MSADKKKVDKKEEAAVLSGPLPGRNDPCRCGSGKKYKKCCLEKDEIARAKAAKEVAADLLAQAHTEKKDENKPGFKHPEKEKGPHQSQGAKPKASAPRNMFARKIGGE
jgi:hypothetical protein